MVLRAGSCCDVYPKVCFLESRDSEMVYGKQMSHLAYVIPSCQCPVSYMKAVCLSQGCFLLTNQLPNTVNILF